MLLTGNLSPEFLVAAGIVLLFGMGWHEYAHAVVADWWGDPTPRQLGRLTPNPLVHISWIGWFMFLFLGFGILGSVPINRQQMRDPRWGSFWTSAAGPISNLIQAVVFALVGHLIINVFGLLPTTFFSRFIYTFINLGVFYNVLLFFFNLVPFVIPAGLFTPTPLPFDGWTMMYSMLPGDFLSYKSMPSFVKEYMRPLARFLSQPAYVWREWIVVMSYITIGIIILSFVLPPALNPLTFLITLPTYRLMSLMGY